MVLFHEVVSTSTSVGATSSRLAKSRALADLLLKAEPAEVEAAVGFLVGEPRQGRIGIGWKTLQGAAAASPEGAIQPSLTVADIDSAITKLAGQSGPGSAAERISLLAGLFGQSTAAETAYLTRLLGGELRQGALAGVMTDAVAKASGIPATLVRRAVMMGGRLDTTARIALTEGPAGLEGVGLEPGRPLQPMLASTAATVTEAIEAIGEASVEWKLDGIRIQVHRRGNDVTVYTRNLNDITDRLPELVAVVRSLPATTLVMDGEALVLDQGGRPVMFQDTASRVATETERTEAVLPHFFDLLHVDGRDLVDEPLAVRLAELERVAGPHRIPGTVTADGETGEAVLVASLAAGHEGVMVKALSSPYEAGRRGKAWRKVKPVHTLDLVVLAVEWGYGRRTGWLSNLHLGALADDGSGFMMVGKTFKGMTDEMLRWQTERFQSLAEREETWTEPQTGTVWVRPEQVVEIRVDGVQRSTKYPGDIALRFARVVGYRSDKSADEADRLSTVQALLPR